MKKRLEELKKAFQQDLTKRIDQFSQRQRDLLQNPNDLGIIKDIHLLAHNLIGAARTFGYTHITQRAIEIEKLAKGCLETQAFTASEITEKISDEIRLLKHALHQEVPVDIHYEDFITRTDLGRTYDNKPKTIFALEDDPITAELLESTLLAADYQVKVFRHPEEFLAAYGETAPDAIIMDMIIGDEQDAGTQILERISQPDLGLPPTIVLSVRNDLAARLAALRSGALRYFVKPIEPVNLVNTLDGLTNRLLSIPYRVLIIDDDEIQAQFYSGVLQKAGINTQVVTDPLKGLEAVYDYEPDLLLCDVHMTNCSGLELAAVIRQDDKFALLPIVFLSSESDIQKQLIALDLGGDDFISKPASPDLLVASLLPRLKRSRWVHRLRGELVDTLSSLRLAKDEAEQATRIKSEFLSRMSHELRTPLNAILGFGQLLEADENTSRTPFQRDSVKEILHAGRHLLELIDDILDLSKIEAGHLKIHPEDIELGPILDECIGMNKHVIESNDLSISITKPEHPLIAFVDKTRLKQVFLNFLSNAIKYNKPGGEIRVLLSKSEDMARICVEDTGVGIPKSFQEQLFTSFNRLGADNTDIEGTGIGLVISKYLMESMDGRVGFSSEWGKGSTFWLEAPLAKN